MRWVSLRRCLVTYLSTHTFVRVQLLYVCIYKAVCVRSWCGSCVGVHTHCVLKRCMFIIHLQQCGRKCLCVCAYMWSAVRSKWREKPLSFTSLWSDQISNSVPYNLQTAEWFLSACNKVQTCICVRMGIYISIIMTCKVFVHVCLRACVRVCVCVRTCMAYTFACTAYTYFEVCVQKCMYVRMV